jgi:NitT/TauT family transport system substrate-binding protein
MRSRLLVSVMAASLLAASPASAMEKVRAGILKMAALTDLWVAKQAGIFEKNGLDVDLVEFRNGNEAIAAHRSGSVDFVLSIPGTAMTAAERGFDLVLLMQNETAKAKGPDAGSIMVLNDSPYKQLSDLNGKRVAVSALHSQMMVSTKMALEKGAADPSTIQFMEMPLPSMGDALKSKQVDAVAHLDPWVTQLQVTGVARNLSWLYVDSIPEQPIGAWYATARYLVNKKDVATAFVKSIREAIDYMNADPERARKNVALFTGLDPKLTEAMPLNKWDYNIHPDRWQATIDMMAKSGELQQPHKAADYLSDVAKQFIVQ